MKYVFKLLVARRQLMYTVSQKKLCQRYFWITPWNIGRLYIFLARNITKKL